VERGYGLFTGASVISTSLSTLASTQSVAFSMTLNILGVWNNVGFGFNYNGAQVAQVFINGANQFIDLEVNFAAGASQKLALTFGLVDQSLALQYTISDVAITYSNAQVGQIYNLVTGGFDTVFTSFYSSLLNNIFTSGFTGFALQPI